MQTVKQRETWVDNVKVTACILVVLGHFFQSMNASHIIPSIDLFYWFNQTIYYFHVPLFFICSGYLYQQYSTVNNAQTWGRNVTKKLLSLGVPYIIFSFATWVLKTAFSDSVNSQIGNLGDVLFLHPTAPYWYLYALFFLFLITPTFKNKKAAAVGFCAALVLKIICIIFGKIDIQAILYILKNEIWFVIGMCISSFDLKKYLVKSKIIIPAAAGVIFVGLSVLVYALGIDNRAVAFLLGLLACYAVVALTAKISSGKKQSAVMNFFSRYTMPIFLMHTLFAAPLRALLLKVGIQNAVIQIVLGLAISFIGPVIAAIIMRKLKWPEFIMYPGKFIKLKKK